MIDEFLLILLGVAIGYVAREMINAISGEKITQ